MLVKTLTGELIFVDKLYIMTGHAGMAELVDAIDSKSIDRKVMRVRVPLPAQMKNALLKALFSFVPENTKWFCDIKLLSLRNITKKGFLS